MQEKKESLVLSDDFIQCWHDAGRHLQQQIEGGPAMDTCPSGSADYGTSFVPSWQSAFFHTD